MEVTFIFFVLAVPVALIGFAVWVLIFISRIFRGVFGLFAPRRTVKALPPIADRPILQPMNRCRRSNCRTMNPSHARFCRRCGMSMRTDERATVDGRLATSASYDLN